VTVERDAAARRPRARSVHPEEVLERVGGRGQQRLVHLLAGELAGLEEPAAGCRHAPQLRAAAVADVPADRLLFEVDELVVRREQLDAVLIGVAQIQEDGVADAVPAAGTPAGIGAPAGRFLKVGDVVRGEIAGLGAIENRVVAEG